MANEYITREALIDALSKLVERGDERWAPNGGTTELIDELRASLGEVTEAVGDCARRHEVVTDDRVSELVDYAVERVTSASDMRYALKAEAVSEGRVAEIVDEMRDEFHSATVYFGNQQSPTLKRVSIGAIDE